MTSIDKGVDTGRTVQVGNREIYFSEFGSGPAVVLLHGGGPGATGLSNYSRNIEALAQHFRVLVLDMPGYGRSSKYVDQSDPFGDLARVLGEFLDALQIDSAHLIGNSYGGAAALRLAMDRPDKVGRLILMGPGGVGSTRALPTKGLQELLAYYPGSGPSREKIIRFIREFLVYDGATVPDEVIEERYRASIDPEVVANPPLRRPSGLFALRTLWRMDFTRDSRLSEVAHPTLVVWGEDDKVNRPSGGRMLAETMPNCDLYLVARTGHWAQWERAELFNTLAIAYLKAER
ncbi:2-hydroxy-6-oxonona-2,4-dienedioate hydrolase/4,5:9,10-diseco-3-hydroxy-5,9,17-trioxoandrosta-1(10),2-diene-4-oate hydrolase [Nocardia alba]|uniref:2-hydroxy-6-oxonona-2,4-dienedioate hydrolase/4,5:9,10-diseco-3-hydroxy-5,9, 17-trioxoandrosta-1(10),2-diene-4-oate hydrolase n=1 Tax=Nocardia alba TaxID=225051 RepID=A0A4R1FS88_9NOCA|nr:2-hydroxy-6-oxonona-2,4-dienedioate hydrolase/4,5:9,10-diseco-3-hydroxy-5,9,17-trioxoandrosta-1(10),2-diene-4-oate hydrolase [Nocardia alba]